jgi:hypothetical protein
MSKQKLTNTELTTREVYENLGTGLGEMHKGGRFEPVNISQHYPVLQQPNRDKRNNKLNVSVVTSAVKPVLRWYHTLQVKFDLLF